MLTARRPLTLALLALLACKPPAPVGPEGDAAAAGDAAAPGKDAILAGSDLPALLPQPLAGDAIGVTIHRLSNGLTVYISTDREQPSFTAWTAVRAGSRHDPAASTGLAHYLEHMMFKGTTKLGTLDFAAERPHIERIEALYGDLRKTEDPAARQAIFAEIDRETQATAKTAIPNEFDRTMAELGISGVNAFTSDEMTVYIQTVPRNRLEAWARLESARFRDPVFRLFYPELEAVYEEKNITLDSPEDRVWEAMLRALFPRHPYGTQPTIGSSEHLKNPAYADMVAYYERWYVPNNMAILLAGDIDAATALPVLERAFGDWQPQPLTPPEPGEITPVRGRQALDIVAEGEQSVTISWQTVGIDHEDEPVLTAMDAIVDNATSGILQTELLLPQKVPAASSGGDNMREAGYWAIMATAREDQTHAEVEELLLGVVKKLKEGAFTDDELAAMILHYEIGEKMKQESIYGRIWPMAMAFVHHQPWERIAGRLGRLRKVKRDDVIRVANKYLGDDRVVVLRRRGEHKPPAIPKPTITPVEIDPGRRSAFAQELLAIPAPELAPQRLREGVDYRHGEVSAGPLIHSKNPRSDLFEIDYAWDFGSRRRPLVCHALELMERSGAGDLDAAALKRRLYHLGTGISSWCTDERLSINVRGIDANMDASLQLLDAWLRSPRFTDETVKLLLDNTLSLRRDSLDDPDFVAYALSLYASRGKQSPLLAEPSNAALKKATGKDLARELAELPAAGHTTLYFGPRDLDAAREGVGLGKDHKKATPRPPRVYRQVKAPTLFFTHKDTTQAKVNVVFPQPPLPRADRITATMLGNVLGGDMSGAIFQEVREARGLAYSAYGTYRIGERPDDAASLFGALGTQADKTLDALSVLLGLLRAAPLTPERFAAAKTAAIAEYRADYIGPRDRLGAVLRWDRRGEAEDPRGWELAGIEAAELAAVQAFAGRFAAAPVIISVMGDKGRIDLAALRKLGKVEEVTIDTMVSYGPFPAAKKDAKTAAQPDAKAPAKPDAKAAAAPAP